MGGYQPLDMSGLSLYSQVPAHQSAPVYSGQAQMPYFGGPSHASDSATATPGGASCMYPIQQCVGQPQPPGSTVPGGQGGRMVDKVSRLATFALQTGGKLAAKGVEKLRERER
jgi:hypothetical protein